MKLDLAAPPIEFIRDRLRYEPDTGHFYMLRSAGRRKVGARAGYPDRLGYWKVAINGKWIMAHRLAWRMVHGEWPLYEIDHINGDPSDNRIENLRNATAPENNQNLRMPQKNNKTGVLGVSLDKGMYKAQICINGKNKNIGRFDTIEKATKAYIQAKRESHEFCTI